MQEGDRVYVTKEEEGMCLGICNNCFGKFPKDILKRLSTDEVIHSELPLCVYTQYLLSILSVATLLYGTALSCTSETRKTFYLYKLTHYRCMNVEVS